MAARRTRSSRSRPERLSRLLSLVLRHDPGRIGIALDRNGYVDVSDLLGALAATGTRVARDELDALVRENDKQRFAFSPDGARIRASQGHSVPVDLGYESAAPPDVLFHGTVERFLDSIRAEGLAPRGRHHVHLSPTIDRAVEVGGRRGAPVVLQIAATEMARSGHAFFVTPNEVWLTATVPAEFIRFPEPGRATEG